MNESETNEPTNYKSCDLCGGVAPEATETCPNDGEASWSAHEPTPAPAAPAASQAPKSKGRK
jgi:hypothetical protein